jgi:hypothetical protein
MDLRPVSLDAVTVTSSSIPSVHSAAQAPSDLADMGTVPGERPGEVPRHSDDLGAATPAVHCPLVVILQISKPGILGWPWRMRQARIGKMRDFGYGGDSG